GFVGQWLTRELVRRDVTVFGGTVTGTPAPGILSAAEIGAVHWLTLDVLSESDIAAALQASDPDWIIHLAGVAFPPEASAAPVRALEINALGMLRLLAGLGAGRPERRVLVVGSAEQYGAHPSSDNPLRETAALLPISAY